MNSQTRSDSSPALAGERRLAWGDEPFSVMDDVPVKARACRVSRGGSCQRRRAFPWARSRWYPGRRPFGRPTCRCAARSFWATSHRCVQAHHDLPGLEVERLASKSLAAACSPGHLSRQGGVPRQVVALRHIAIRAMSPFEPGASGTACAAA
jgi:hypothetical protein